MKFTVVIPVKDESFCLKYCLPSVYALHPKEIILVMEQRFQDTVNTAKSIARQFDIPTRIIEVNVSENWANPHAYARRLGFEAAETDLILTIDVDKVADPNIPKYFFMIDGEVKLLSFREVPLGLDIRNHIKNVLQALGYARSFGGIYLISKKAWQETEDPAGAKKVLMSEDTYLHKQLLTKFRYRFIKRTKNLCLKSDMSVRKQFLNGVECFKRGENFYKLLLSSFLYFMPIQLLGYLYAKRKYERESASDRGKGLHW